MSSETPTEAPVDATALRRYRRTTAVVLGGLAVAAVALALLGLAQGPRIVDAQADPATGIANQTAAPTTTSDDAEDPLVTELVRDPNGDDRIVQRRVSGADQRTLVTAPEIQEYALLGDQVLVIARNAYRQPFVGLATPGDDDLEPIIAGDLDEITQLQVEPTTRMAGYLLDGVDGRGEPFTGYLLLQDLRFGAGTITEVLGPTLQPLEVARWWFEPGTTTVIAEDVDGGYFRFSPLSGDVAAKSISAAEAEATLRVSPGGP